MAELANNEWKLYDAKNRLSEVVNLALTVGPQCIHRNKDEVYVISREQYEQLTGKKKSFLEFLKSAPSFEGLDLERDKSLGRDIEL